LIENKEEGDFLTGKKLNQPTKKAKIALIQESQSLKSIHFFFS
jgi:hypothetical protein